MTATGWLTWRWCCPESEILSVCGRSPLQTSPVDRRCSGTDTHPRISTEPARHTASHMLTNVTQKTEENRGTKRLKFSRLHTCTLIATKSQNWSISPHISAMTMCNSRMGFPV